MKQLAAIFAFIVLASCYKQHLVEPPIYQMNRQWFRIETPNLDPIHYRFCEDGTMVESNSTYTKTYTATLDGSEVWLQLGWNTRHWDLTIIEEDKLRVIENVNKDTFIIVCK